jgi:threonine dehydrogenase-like Zn-dependent dehydrogenase
LCSRHPHVIGHDPDAPGAFGELMRVSEMMTRAVPDGVPDDAVALVDASVGEYYVRISGIARVNCRSSSGPAPSACQRSRR